MLTYTLGTPVPCSTSNLKCFGGPAATRRSAAEGSEFEGSGAPSSCT
jgi:hypothetical protein